MDFSESLNQNPKDALPSILNTFGKKSLSILGSVDQSKGGTRVIRRKALGSQFILKAH